MTQPIERDAIYRRCRFSRETIETCVRWYVTYRLSCRDLVAMMAERGIRVSHSTILRWVFRYVPEYERRFNQCSRRVASSWRVAETYIRVGAEMMYLYRGVDKYGKTVASLLSPTRSIEAGMEFFRRAAAAVAPRFSRKITLDGYRASHQALRALRCADHRWKYVLVRSSRYLSNIVEQDHRAVKVRCQAMLRLRSYQKAAVTIAGIALAHRIRKQQCNFGPGRRARWSLKQQWETALS